MQEVTEQKIQIFLLSLFCTFIVELVVILFAF